MALCRVGSSKENSHHYTPSLLHRIRPTIPQGYHYQLSQSTFRRPYYTMNSGRRGRGGGGAGGSSGSSRSRGSGSSPSVDDDARDLRGRGKMPEEGRGSDKPSTIPPATSDNGMGKGIDFWSTG